MKKETRLYNVLFPIWMFYFFPVTWVYILPGNFVIDSLVLLLAMAAFRYENKFRVWKGSILKVWLFGFLSDFMGAALTFGLMFLCELLCPGLNTFNIPGGQLIVLPGIALAGVLICFFNRKFSFQKTGLGAEEIKKLSFTLALWTAPYTMLIPVEWIY